MAINDCEICKLLAESKDYIGTHCIKCGAALPSDKFEDELKDILKLPYDDKNREQIHKTLSNQRYVNMKYYVCQLSIDNNMRTNLLYVFTHKMLNNIIPGLSKYDIDQLFTVSITKNIYRLCDIKDCIYCMHMHDAFIAIGCNAAIFYYIVR